MVEGKSEKIVKGRVATNPGVDKFWIDYGKDTLKNTAGTLDERAKYMITTCASLIVINFGLLVAFESRFADQLVLVKVTPQLFLVISSASFVISFFPLRKLFQLDVPRSIEDAYNLWIDWKLKWHYGGFAFFIAGLLTIALTSMLK